MAQTVWEQDWEVAGHIAFAVREQRAVSACAQTALSFVCSPRSMAQKVVLSIFKVSYPSRESLTELILSDSKS